MFGWFEIYWQLGTPTQEWQRRCRLLTAQFATVVTEEFKRWMKVRVACASGRAAASHLRSGSTLAFSVLAFPFLAVDLVPNLLKFGGHLGDVGIRRQMLVLLRRRVKFLAGRTRVAMLIKARPVTWLP